jgi:hypothetical protein
LDSIDFFLSNTQSYPQILWVTFHVHKKSVISNLI